MDSKKDEKQFRITSKALYIILLTGATLVVFFIARQFLLPIILAAITAGIFWPIHGRIRSLFHRPSPSAVVSLILVTAIMVVPLGVVGFLSVRKAVVLAENIITNVESMESLYNGMTNLLSSIPLLNTIDFQDAFSGTRLIQFLRRLGGWFTDIVGEGPRNILIIPLLIFIYFYSLYFFLKEGDTLSKRLVGTFPLEEKYQHRIMERFVSVTGAILKSTFAIGTIHGVIGGLTVRFLGLEGGLFAGVLLVVLAVVPNIGAIFVWLPLTIVFLAQGRPVAGVIMFGVGIALGLIDYILRPRLVGKDIQIHQILVLIGVLGGMALFGLFGFIIGPIAVSLFVILWQMLGQAMRGTE